MSATTKAHNLDIHMYSLKELLALFNTDYNISFDYLKRAKKQVLMTHPDKSKLPAYYFLFYKKAFDIVVNFYNNQNKQSQQINAENTTYVPTSVSNTDKSTTKQVVNAINNMNKREFQDKFNTLFENTMVKKQNNTRNEWFSKDEPIYDTQDNVNANNMGQMFDKIKEKQSGMVKYTGVNNLVVNSGSGTNFYDEEDDNDDTYVTSDPFSKLKYDDLRKVHKDETILAVSERDFNKVKQYKSVDHIMRERGSQSLTPIEKQEAERMLSIQEQQYRERMMNKGHSANLQTMQYAEKNKAVLSQFLRLTNSTT
jgi:hypothetical protein